MYVYIYDMYIYMICMYIYDMYIYMICMYIYDMYICKYIYSKCLIPFIYCRPHLFHVTTSISLHEALKSGVLPDDLKEPGDRRVMGSPKGLGQYFGNHPYYGEV